MKLRSQISLFTLILLLTTVITISSLSIYLYQQNAYDAVESYRQDEVTRAKNRLKSIVTLAYDLLDSNEGESSTVTINQVLQQIRSMRFDNGDGYFWIINDRLPYPDLILHATHPGNEGQSTDDPKYHIVTGKPGKNFHQETVEKNLKDGKGFIDYYWVRPDKTKTYNKLSYSKYLKSRGWIISTAIYVDIINENVASKKTHVDEQVKKAIIVISIAAVFILIVSLLIGINQSKKLVKIIEDVADNLKTLARGKLGKEITNTRKDEFGDIVVSLNSLIRRTNIYSDFAIEIGKGNLSADFNILNEEDRLGYALLAMRDNLKELISQTNSAVKMAGEAGNLTVRMDIAKKEGAWKDLSISINNLLHSIATPIIDIKEIVEEMANGKLTSRYTKDSSGDFLLLTNGLNQALENLNNLLLKIAQSSSAITNSSTEMLDSSVEMDLNTNEIATAMAEMSQGAQKQVIKIDESASLVEGILNSSNEMRERAETINNVAKKGVENSEKGKVIANDVASSVGKVSDYSKQTKESIKVLTDRSKEIANVLSVITEIASQTNLLALNAAIEAAQAGAAGRGFAVVAEEIRKLAENSRKSAQEIDLLISGVQQDTNQAASVIDKMTLQVENVTKRSMESLSVFKNITSSSQETLVFSEAILKSSDVQVNDINDVVNIIESVVVIAEETAAGTEEVSSSATELSNGMTSYNQKSAELKKIASELKQGVSLFDLENGTEEATSKA